MQNNFLNCWLLPGRIHKCFCDWVQRDNSA